MNKDSNNNIKHREGIDVIECYAPARNEYVDKIAFCVGKHIAYCDKIDTRKDQSIIRWRTTVVAVAMHMTREKLERLEVNNI